MEGLVDRIYEAGLVPELWPEVLDEITALGNGYATFLFSVTNSFERWLGSKNGGYGADYIAEGWPQRTDRALRLIRARHAGFLGDLDVYTREELEVEPVFVEFLRPRGIGWGAATAITVSNGDMLVFDLERRIETGPVEAETIARLDALRPHLARAGMLSTRLAFERARAAAEALEAVGLPAGVLSQSGQLIVANDLLQAFVPAVVMDRRERLLLADPAADALLAEALVRGLPCGCSMPIAASAEHSDAIIAHLIPVRRQAQDVFSLAAHILVLTPVIPANVPAADVLQGLFDLTAAEARVARGIAEGKTIDGISERFGVSRETVRTQLKSVLLKTGTTRQVDLALLLTGARIPGEVRNL